MRGLEHLIPMHRQGQPVIPWLDIAVWCVPGAADRQAGQPFQDITSSSAKGRPNPFWTSYSSAGEPST